MNCLKFLLLIICTLIPFLAFAGQADTINNLVSGFNDKKCRECHQEIYDQWKETPHSEAVILSLDGLRNFLVYGVKDWWGREITKSEVMKCLDCHAPVMKFATEGLAIQVADLIIAAVDSEDKSEANDAKNALARLNVGCMSCHNIKATSIATGRLGEPVENAVYGTHGKTPVVHKTIMSSELKTSMFCMQCHGNYTAPDGEVIKCNTLNGSYQDNYVSRGGAHTCQDCHIKAKNGGHRMLGGRDLKLVKEGIGFDVEIANYMQLPGKGETRWTPSALVNVTLENRAGHRIPDG